MKKYKYVGLFKADNGHEYELTVYCLGFIQALILLTAEAIKTSRHYQLYSITMIDKKTEIVKYIDDICKIGVLIK